MKTKRPAIIALVLWLLFVASNEFRMFKSLYPRKADSPYHSIVLAPGKKITQSAIPR